MDMHSGANSKIRLHISNIPYEMKWQELKDLLREKVNADVFVEIFNGPDGRPSGVGYIEVKTPELAKKIIEAMHRSDIRGRQIIVREENEEDIIRRLQMSNTMGTGLAGARPPGMPPPGPHNLPPPMAPPSMTMMNSGSATPLANDFSLQLVNDLGIDPANITNQVFVANLDYKVTAEMLEEVFRIAGNVLSVELKMDKENKFRGMATVRFEHPMESVQAISLFNGQRYHGRNMSVRMDRWNDPKPQIVPKMLPPGLESIGVGLGIGGRPLYNLGQISNTLALANLSGFLRSKGAAGNGISGANLMPSQRGYGMGQGPNAGGAVDSTGTVGGIGNLEAIIAATIRAVTGQMGALGSPTDGGGGLLRGSANMGNMAGMDLGSSSGYGAAGGIGVSNRWPGSSPMNMPVSSSPGMPVGDKDPNMLYVGNSLKDLFKEVGDVLFADIKIENGRSAGYGTVRMRNPDDAVSAIARLNGSFVDGRQIEVRWLRKPSASFGLGKPNF